MKWILSCALLLSSLQLFAKDSLKLLSYNVGLAHTFVPLAKERTDHLITAIKKSSADVICLQEVWTKKDQKKLKKELKKVFPHSFTTKIKQSRTKAPTCRRKDLFGEGKFVSCLKENCDGLSGDEHTACVLDTCKTPMENLKNSKRMCAQALMAQVGKSPTRAIMSLLNPLWGAGIYTYGGGNGLMLLSKVPLKNTKLIDMSQISTLNRRSGLKADVELTGKGDVSLICTHLTANLSKSVPYTGLFDDWEQEQYAQVVNLVEQVPFGKSVLFGDFNCGFGDEQANLSPEFPNNCQRLVNSGYSTPLANDVRECTICESNTLRDAGSENSLIDHVFIRGVSYKDPKVTMKQKVQVSTGKEIVETSLSDHYGVELTIY